MSDKRKRNGSSGRDTSKYDYERRGSYSGRTYMGADGGTRGRTYKSSGDEYSGRTYNSTGREYGGSSGSRQRYSTDSYYSDSYRYGRYSKYDDLFRESSSGSSGRRKSRRTSESSVSKSRGAASKKRKNSASGSTSVRSDRSSTRRKARVRKGKRAFKKRFYVIITVLAIIVLMLTVLGVKTVADSLMSNVSGNVETVSKTDNVKNVDSSNNVGTTGSGGNSSSENISSVILDDTGIFGVTPAVMIEEDEDEDGEPVEIDPADEDIAIEERVRSAVINSNEASLLGKYQTQVSKLYGDFIRYEDWNGGEYYHKDFDEGMYIVYNAEPDADNTPAAKSKCIIVSTTLKNIMDVEPFTPSEKYWGTINEDRTGTGWSDYYYSVLIKKDTVMIVYCNKKGVVDGDDHIIIKKYI